MKTSESFANYFPVYGRVILITPPLCLMLQKQGDVRQFMKPVTGRIHKSLWHSCILPHGLDGGPHKYLSALSNRLNAWSLSFMNMLKCTTHPPLHFLGFLYFTYFINNKFSCNAL